MRTDRSNNDEDELNRRDEDEGLNLRDNELGAPSRLDGQQQHLRVQPSPPHLSTPTSPSHQRDSEQAENKKNDPKTVAWRDLPQKPQLAIITLARLSEPLVQTSLQAYLFYQLRLFDPSLPDSTISSQAGILHASFMGAQFCTAMLWGRIADSSRFGRKTVLLVGLIGTSLSCLGFGFAKGFWSALIFRTLGGATNGNIGVMRTMYVTTYLLPLGGISLSFSHHLADTLLMEPHRISEIIREKKFQSRAFLLLPMTFNIGVIIGPILGGILSDPAGSYPKLFKGVAFFENYPYATPNIVSSVFLLFAAAAVWLGLDETLDSIRDSGRVDFGRRLGGKLTSVFKRKGAREGGYESVPGNEVDTVELPDTPVTPKAPKKRFTKRLPFRRIFTRNVTLTLLNQFLIAFHVGTFNSMWFVFLSTPVYNPKTSETTIKLPFRFTGGLGLQPQSIGFAMAILGAIGITLQLFVYPKVSARLGTVRSWRTFLCCFPLSYFLVPYLSVVPSTTAPPEAKTGAAVWLSLFGVLLIQVLGRTFALPAQTILVNNCSPHPSVLGTVHGLGQSMSSGARTIGPMLGGVVYGVGLNAGYVGLFWWCLSVIAICGFCASLLAKEGDGHEIWLEGDDED